MPEQITKWITNDGYEYDTEKQAILHESHQKEIEQLVKELTIHTNLYSPDALEVAEYIVGVYKLEKRSCLG